MESNARALSNYNYGTVAPTIQAMVEAETRRLHAPPKRVTTARERPRRIEKPKVATAEKVAPKISVFAIFGTVFVSALMILVVLAQINFNETAAETVRLNAHIAQLEQQHRALELSLERAVDLRTIEHYARDVLGMSRPDVVNSVAITSAPRDTAIVIQVKEESGLDRFGYFIMSLLDYFR
ncbi:MAG: cell division protein FtsL [Oscillospiraceae bacterium]|nr:cell division protein FtsL [Oscillospiraceae bacterium]